MLQKPTISSPDYQRFFIEEDGSLRLDNDSRMYSKHEALKLNPEDLRDKSVLDIGCDFGFWSFLAANYGAYKVVGLDRNRNVRGIGPVNLVSMNNQTAREYPKLSVCEFHEINLGKQWFEYGVYDVVFLFSLYHHIYQNVGDHKPIWYWLWRSTSPGGVLIWENPLDQSDVVVRMNMSPAYQQNYTKEKILAAASEYFDAEYIGPAEHEPTRSVYKFHPKTRNLWVSSALTKDGAGGATKAFTYANDRRIEEIKNILGMRPLPGSLNCLTLENFDIDKDYLRAEMLDVADRTQGMDSSWKPRWVRFYPLTLDGIGVYAMRFEGEKYDNNFVEIISHRKLRDQLTRDKVILCR